jgi:molecular chaperone GrpE
MENIQDEREVNWKDQYIRILADYENLKKRTNKSILDTKKQTLIDVFNNLLPIYWDLSRGVSTMANADQGVTLVLNNFKNFFTNTYNLKIIDNSIIGNKFDDRYMSAVTFVPALDERHDNYVYDVVSPGLIDPEGNVLVYAKVIVYKC